jgi:hypothetical protein
MAVAAAEEADGGQVDFRTAPQVVANGVRVKQFRLTMHSTCQRRDCFATLIMTARGMMVRDSAEAPNHYVLMSIHQGPFVTFPTNHYIGPGD